MREWLGEVRLGLWVYASHVGSLFLPGWKVSRYREPPRREAPLQDWGEEDLEVMIEEGRRQFDQQGAKLADVRDRAQWLFGAGILLAGAGAALGKELLRHPADLPLGLWSAGLLAMTLGMLGAVAILTVRADFNAVHTWPLSNYTPPVGRQLARDYAEMLEAGEETINTRVSVYRQAVIWLLLAGSLTFAAWLAY